jgi:hypothetical protein
MYTKNNTAIEYNGATVHEKKLYCGSREYN